MPIVFLLLQVVLDALFKLFKGSPAADVAEVLTLDASPEQLPSGHPSVGDRAASSRCPFARSADAAAAVVSAGAPSKKVD